MAKPKPEKKPEPAPPTTRRVLPMDLQIGDRLTDESGEWEVIARPYTTAGGKTARVRVQRVGEPAVTELRAWGAHERVSYVVVASVPMFRLIMDYLRYVQLSSASVHDSSLFSRATRNLDSSARASSVTFSGNSCIGVHCVRPLSRASSQTM